MALPVVLNAVTVDTATTYDWPGGAGMFYGFGTWGSGTLALSWSPDDGTTYYAYGSPCSLTSNGFGAFTLPPCKIKLALTGSTNATITGGVGKTTPTVR